MNNPNNNPPSSPKPLTFIGIDWADQLHAFHVVDTHKNHSPGTFIQNPAVIEERIVTWRKQFPDTTLAVAIEQSKGALVTALLKYDDVVIYPINPAALASYRKSFRHGGGKNDPTDAMLLAQYLQHYHHQLRPLREDSSITRELAALAVDRRRLVDQRVDLANQLQALLKQYFPAILELKPAKVYADFMLRILLKYPTLTHIQKASTKSLTACFKGTSSRRIPDRIQLLRNAIPLSEDDVLLRTSSQKMTTLCRLIEVLNDAVDACDKRIKELVQQHNDYNIVAALPGASSVTQCRIIAALGDDRSRFKTATELQASAGIAPLTTQSGKQRTVTCRWACNKFLKQTFHEFAGQSITESKWAEAYYRQQIQRGKKPQAARRSLAFKWIRIIHRCWQARTPYNEQHYIERLKQTQSPLYNLIQQNA